MDLKRDRWMRFRVTEHEERIIKRLAEVAGVKVSDYLRRSAFGERVGALRGGEIVATPVGSNVATKIVSGGEVVGTKKGEEWDPFN